jgi:hypothetical protein
LAGFAASEPGLENLSFLGLAGAGVDVEMTGPKSDFWAIVGGLTGLAGVIVAIFGLFFRHYDASKALEVTLASRSQLLNPEIHGKSPALQLLFNGKEVPDVGILQVRICNSGVQPISKTDFEEPIQFTSDRNQLSISGEGTEIGVSAGVGVASVHKYLRICDLC